MKKLIALIATLAVSCTLSAQTLVVGPTLVGEISGIPTAKTAKKSLVGALVTLSGSRDSDVKYQRVATENGFMMRVPYGDYLLTVEYEGYAKYALEITIEDEETNLGIIRLLTNDEDAKKKEKHKKMQ